MEIIFRTKEKVDYEKIREITREVVKEEISKNSTSQPAPLTKEDIQAAVCNGIIQADIKREEIVVKKAKNTKISRWSMLCIIFFALMATVFLAFSIFFFMEPGQDLLYRITSGFKMLAITMLFVCMAFAEYATSKNRDKNFVSNVIMMLLALASLIIAIIS